MGTGVVVDPVSLCDAHGARLCTRRPEDSMWLVVGLGNPGREYEDSRHNVGFMVTDVLARRTGASWSSKFKGEVAQTRVRNEPALLLKPQTYMNLSGQAVQPCMAFYKIAPATIIVVHDDMDLEMGQIKLKRGGSAGGHNGIKSIDGLVGPNYLRVRAGIGHPRKQGDGQKVVGHVLGAFKGKDKDEAAILVERCADAVEALVSGTLEQAQMVFHTAPGTERPKKPKPETLP
jgi:PTH1 family peptidyl-tRNA hydrolase